MARRYTVSGNATSAANITLVGVTSTAAIRPKVYDILCGSAATPADNAAQFQVLRHTAAGTSTSVTPQAIDPGDPASTATAGKTHSVEPTYTANSIMLDWSQNQRATFRWVAAPGSEIVLPATAANGIGVRCIAIGGSGVNFIATMMFEE